MSSDDGPTESDEPTPGEQDDTESVRKRLEAQADQAVERFDDSVVDLLAWILDTETRARIYVFLRQHPNSTSEEIADGTGLYPSTVREALAELHEESKVQRQKRQNGGAGNNPYEYTAMPPSDLVTGIVGDVQSELNTVFNLDDHLCEDEKQVQSSDEPVTITVDDESGADS